MLLSQRDCCLIVWKQQKHNRWCVEKIPHRCRADWHWDWTHLILHHHYLVGHWTTQNITTRKQPNSDGRFWKGTAMSTNANSRLASVYIARIDTPDDPLKLILYYIHSQSNVLNEENVRKAWGKWWWGLLRGRSFDDYNNTNHFHISAIWMLA